MAFLTTAQAKDKNHREVFISYPALGDQILLLYAAREYHRITGDRALVGTTCRELFENQDFCDVLDGLSASTLTKMFAEVNAAGIKVHPVTYYQPHKSAEGALRFSFPSVHLISEMVSRLGASGQVVIDPVFDLAEEEKGFGRFFQDTQIAVMSHGKEKRKSWGVDNMQALVNRFRDRYNFVQLGSPGDAPLEGVLDKRGAFPLRQVAATLHNSDLFIGGIGALVHLARGVGCPAVVTYSASEPLNVDSYACNMNIMPVSGCTICQTSVIGGENEDAECVDAFSCVRNIQMEDVAAAVVNTLSKAGAGTCNPVTVEVCGNKATALNPLTARLFGMAQKGGLVRKG